MPYDLATMARAKGIRRDITVRPVEPARGPEQDLASLYLAVLKAWAPDAILRGYTGGLTTDAPADQTSAIEEAGNVVTRLIAEFTSGLRGWIVRAEQVHRSRWAAAVKSSTDIDLSMVLSGYEVQETLDVFLDRNVALVRNVSDQARGRIADAVFKGYQERQPAHEVAKEIREATGLARDRSVRIASDQNSKLSAALDRERQAEAGIDLFRWRHSGKLHPRQPHLHRNGNIYDRASGKQVNADGSKMAGETVARGDFPGEQPYCGCRAQAYLPLMGELGI
ncbi:MULTISPECIES: phage minor head protein [unclassified Novosphingobium]|uniref:phage minor head protein n=1 Tax=unclassified Novosphingobium TaxID=2644732 RepID=UPI00135B94A2|nr:MULTISPECIES: phage minor head protein [unclassified Novosphingobium]